MKAQRMNKLRFTYLIAAFTALVLVFTGCSNPLTTKSDKKNTDSNSILFKGNISSPAAMSKSLRSAITSYEEGMNGELVKYKVTAQTTINGEQQELSDFIEPDVYNSFSFKLLKVNASWTIYVEMLLQDKDNQEKSTVIMTSSPQDVNTTVDKIEVYVEEPFYLAPVTQGDQIIKTGSINLPVKKSEDSTVQKIKWELKPIDKEQSSSVPSITDMPEFGDEDITSLVATDIPAGTWQANLHFIDEIGMIYGPVVEAVTVSPGFVTDCWYGTDTFIDYSFDDEMDIFTIPSDAQLVAIFPNYTYSKPLTGDAVLLWSYSQNKPEYKVYPLDESGKVTGAFYPFAQDVKIVKAEMDFVTKDVYVLTAENTIRKYTAESCYSQFIENTAADNMILTFAANNGSAYVLCYYMNVFAIYKFDTDGSELLYTGNIDLNPAVDFRMLIEKNSFKMSVCDNYIFLAYSDYQSYCQIFNENNITDEGNYKIMNDYLDLDGLLDLSIVPGSLPAFDINDIQAVSKGSGIPDLYAVAGLLTVQYSGSIGKEVSPVAALSYGALIKITTKQEGTDYTAALDNDYGIKGLIQVPQTLTDYFLCNADEEDKCFYYPLKFVGYNNGKYIIADDGISFEVITGDLTRFVPSKNKEKNNLVTINLANLTEISAQDIQAAPEGFDSYFTDGSFINYRLMNGMTGGPAGGTALGEIGHSYLSMETEWSVSFKTMGDYGSLVDGYNSDYRYVKLPKTKNDPLYFYVEPDYGNVKVNSIIYCNGKDINEGLPDSQKYYVSNAQDASLSLLRALPVLGNYSYTLYLDVVQTIPVQGSEPTVMHQDFIYVLQPQNEFNIREEIVKADLQAYLDSIIIDDTASFKSNISINSQYFDSMLDTLYNYVNNQNCPYITIDFSITSNLTEVRAGMCGVNASLIKFPTRESRSKAIISNIQKGAFTKNNVNFEGDLIIHKSLQGIENGAFAVPPRSVSMDMTGYGNTNQDSNGTNFTPKFAVKDVMEAGGTNLCMLAEMSGYHPSRIVVCTKRDEPFTPNFESTYTSITQIDDNAFKGLPVYTESNSPLKLGTIYNVGRDSFENTSVRHVHGGENLRLLGNKAFSSDTLLSLNSGSGGTWFKCYTKVGNGADLEDYESIWEYSVNDLSITNNDITNNFTTGKYTTVQIEGDSLEDKAQNIIDAINQPYTFVFKRIDS